jgi:hypothetical protein
MWPDRAHRPHGGADAAQGPLLLEAGKTRHTNGDIPV